MLSIDLDLFIKNHVIKRDESLLYRDMAENEENLKNLIEGHSFLVIGGAGSIGSSFVRAILPFKPAEIIIVDTNENALVELTRYLRASYTYCGLIPPKYVTYPMDYNGTAFRHMYIKHKKDDGHSGFDYVANFAAYKHVRSEKDIYSIESMFRNNLINAKHLLDIIKDNPPKAYFCVSTDKASNPVNIMGASKRMMEDLIFCYSDFFRINTARFANVAFSNGSLLDGFVHRIESHQPISAPTDVKRYFVSPMESGQICMMSAMLGHNREIFFPLLDETQMMTFDEIAGDLLKELGYEIKACQSDVEAIRSSVELIEEQPYPVLFTRSNTDGEKLYEEFYEKREIIDCKRYKSLGVIVEKRTPNKEKVLGMIDEMEDLFEKDDYTKSEIITLISSYLPNFHHVKTGNNLDEKM